MANKHCLLEKPFTVTTEDAKYLVNLAKERNLFLMEVRRTMLLDSGMAQLVQHVDFASYSHLPLAL